MPENKIGILFNNTVLSFEGFENKLTFLCGGLIQSDTVQSLVLDHLEVVREWHVGSSGQVLQSEFLLELDLAPHCEVGGLDEPEPIDRLEILLVVSGLEY